MKPMRLHVANFYEQIGVDSNPVFAWEYVGSEGSRQTAYRLVISRSPVKLTESAGVDIIYDSGRIASDRQNNLEIEQPDLVSHTRYFCRVCCWDQQDRACWSDMACLVTGVLPKDRPSPIWISDADGSGKPYYAVRRLTLQNKPEQAFLSICGLGQFVAYLNGRKIGDHEIDPGWTDYHKRVYYVTFDVTAMMVQGENVLTVEVANGWYLGDTSEGRHFYTRAVNYQPFGTTLPLWFHLTARSQGQDGESIGLQSDGQVLTWPSQTVLANVYGSEDIDRSGRPGPDPAQAKAVARPARILTDAEKPAGILMAQFHPPNGIKMTYTGQLVGQPRPGVLVYDLGQNMAGIYEVFVHGRKGQRVVVRAAETLNPDGSVKPIVSTWSAYTLAGEPAVESFRPQFSYAAGRWVQVEGGTLDSENPDLPQLIAVRGHLLTSQARDAGAFRCSDNRYNQIFQIILKSIESNLNHVHTDCPTVEKLGWLETSHLMAPSVMYNKDVDTLWSKIAADARDSQYGPDEHDVDASVRKHTYGPGLITAIAPRYAKFDRDWGQGSYWDIVPWGSTVILGPWQQYCFYGNTRVLRQNYPAAARYLIYLEQKYQDYPQIYGLTGTARFLCHGLGDWGIGDAFNKSRENTETAFFYHDLTLMARIAGILDKPDDARRWSELAKQVCDNYNEYLLVRNPDTGDWCYKAYDLPDQLVVRQINQALPLSFGMVPADREDSVRRSFLRSTENGVINSGEVGLRFLFNLLHRLGCQDRIHQMILQPEHPSYYRFVLQGETTMPEYWVDHGRSRNHDMIGQIMEWFYRGLLGIESEDGFSHILIAPVLPTGMAWVEGKYQAITGLIQVRFEQSGIRHRLIADVPDNTRTRLILPYPENYAQVTCNGILLEDPDRPIEVDGGHYELTGWL